MVIVICLQKHKVILTFTHQYTQVTKSLSDIRTTKLQFIQHIINISFSVYCYLQNLTFSIKLDVYHNNIKKRYNKLGRSCAQAEEKA